MADDKPARKTVVFFHPDLGIGGAERLVVDAAVGLQKRGHRVVIFTSHCDPQHCFDEARDGTLDVRVRGNTLVPPSILSRFAILCAILRQAHLLLQVRLTGELAALRPTHVFVDQLSAGVPLLRLLLPSSTSSPTPTAKDKAVSSSSNSKRRGGGGGGRVPILFYCHFPDLLLAHGRARWWKRLYRVPFDALEEWSMGFADAVAVNSRFTRGVVAATWPRLAAALGGEGGLKVVYPCIDTKSSGGSGGGGGDNEKGEKGGDGGEKGALVWRDTNIILSINRFERKKDVALAIRAFAGLPKERRKGVRLVVAGGYDNRVAENVGYHRELAELAESLGLRSATTKTVVTALNVPADVEVLFLLSVPSTLKEMLLRSARLLVYTPANEHFGIVPLEAMLAGVPVLACDTGGPTETVVEGVTGWLRPAGEVGRWTEVMDRVLNGMAPAEREAMARAGRARVRENFAEAQMAERLDGIFDEIGAAAARRPAGGRGGVAGFFLLGLVVLLGAVAGAWIGGMKGGSKE